MHEFVSYLLQSSSRSVSFCGCQCQLNHGVKAARGTPVHGRARTHVRTTHTHTHTHIRTRIPIYTEPRLYLLVHRLKLIDNKTLSSLPVYDSLNGNVFSNRIDSLRSKSTRINLDIAKTLTLPLSLSLSLLQLLFKCDKCDASRALRNIIITQPYSSIAFR